MSKDFINLIFCAFVIIEWTTSEGFVTHTHSILSEDSDSELKNGTQERIVKKPDIIDDSDLIELIKKYKFDTDFVADDENRKVGNFTIVKNNKQKIYNGVTIEHHQDNVDKGSGDGQEANNIFETKRNSTIDERRQKLRNLLNNIENMTNSPQSGFILNNRFFSIDDIKTMTNTSPSGFILNNRFSSIKDIKTPFSERKPEAYQEIQSIRLESNKIQSMGPHEIAALYNFAPTLKNDAKKNFSVSKFLIACITIILVKNFTPCLCFS